MYLLRISNPGLDWDSVKARAISARGSWICLLYIRTALVRVLQYITSNDEDANLHRSTGGVNILNRQPNSQYKRNFASMARVHKHLSER